ncbi:hypothetical protein HT031_001600 [Scenedesmus sp. PABB004]|nr:hypothetical protein HT031_001600 [Scenedesmus sp. PABB004]
MYPRAAKLQGGLAVVGASAAAVAASRAPDAGAARLWAAAAALLGGVWPWTLFAMMPTNKTILKQDAAAAEQAALLERWGRLHAARTALSAASLAVAIAALARRT